MEVIIKIIKIFDKTVDETMIDLGKLMENEEIYIRSNMRPPIAKLKKIEWSIKNEG